MSVFLKYLFHFRWYPFDTQTCKMILSPDGNNGEFIDLHEDGLEYLGPMDLTQYFIRSTGTSMSEEGSISVVVVLGRRLLGTLLTVYIPTLLVVTISYSTNFFKPFFFEAVVAVNLTCMLVKQCTKNLQALKCKILGSCNYVCFCIWQFTKDLLHQNGWCMAYNITVNTFLWGIQTSQKSYFFYVHNYYLRFCFKLLLTFTGLMKVEQLIIMGDSGQ